MISPKADAAGGWPGYFLHQGAGARGMAMGRAYVGLGDDVASVLWNAAALTQLPQCEATFLHAALFEGTRYNFVGYAHADPTLGPWAFGGGLAQLYSSGFVRRDANNVAGAEFADAQTAGFLSGAWAPVSGLPLGVGATVKGLSKQVDTLNTNAFALDVSGFWSFADFLSVGATAQNVVATAFQREQGNEQMPVTLLVGGSMWFLDRMVVASVMMEKIGAGSWALHAGAEYNFLSSFQIRGGWDQGYPTGGVGFFMEGWALDYAVLSHPDLGLSHRASVSYRFGPTRREADARVRVRQEFMERRFRDGRALQAAQQWPEALKAFREVLAEEASHGGARQAMAEIRREIVGVSAQVAVGQFRRVTGSARMVAALNKEFPKAFAGATRLSVLDGTQVEAAMKELGFEKTGSSTVEAAKELGKRLGVALVVIGQVEYAEEGVQLTAQVVSIQAGEILASVSLLYPSSDNFTDAVNALAAALAKELSE